MLSTILILVQLVVIVIMGVYFYRQLKTQNTQPTQSKGSSRRDLERLNRLRQIHLTEPLNECVRPASLKDIIGQEDGIQALKAILCGPNPQHVIIYGPPGIGKTCAARLVLEVAKQSAGTPFRDNAPFIEMDATCVRFDERAIADPLIGSVHDPIYQGAGQLGINGVPQPKEGAVTRAHGGVLFLDEIGELHPTQMNKLLKVLEDRLVRFESAYYDPDDQQTPRHIHEIFKSGLPADFRLVGATTRSPADLPPALRSRCIEVFFRALEPEELSQIASGAAEKAGYGLSDDNARLIGRHSESGRDAVNMVQMAVGVALSEDRQDILQRDIEWIIDCGHYSLKIEPKKERVPKSGVVNGLAVFGSHQGALMEIEALCTPGSGHVTVTGIIEEEELGDSAYHKSRRMSMAKAAAENVKTLLKSMRVSIENCDLHINYPGGTPVDGPSAGVSMAVAAYSAIMHLPVACDIAMTGELSILGDVLPVGGVPMKIGAARKAGMKRVLIPEANHQNRYDQMDIEVIPIKTVDEALYHALGVAAAEVRRPAATGALAAEVAKS